MNRTTALKQTELFAFIALALVVILLFVAVDRAELLEERRTTPPIVVLSEEQQSYRFALGSARVSDEFQRQIRTDIIPLLDSLSRQHGADVVEVIGHTDAVPVRSRSTLDERLIEAYQNMSAEDVSAGSNVDLGMMRALSIVRALRQGRDQGELSRIERFVPYSAGQMVMPDGSLAEATDPARDRGRRRIEIRLRRQEDYRRAEIDE
jgi:flagellar motor protein MotB